MNSVTKTPPPQLTDKLNYKRPSPHQSSYLDYLFLFLLYFYFIKYISTRFLFLLIYFYSISISSIIEFYYISTAFSSQIDSISTRAMFPTCNLCNFVHRIDQLTSEVFLLIKCFPFKCHFPCPLLALII